MRCSFLIFGILSILLSLAAAQDPDSVLTIMAFIKKSETSYAVQFSTSHTMPDPSITQYHVIKIVEETLPEQTEAYTNDPPVETSTDVWEVTFSDGVNLELLSTKTVHLVLNGLDANFVPVIKGDISVSNFPAVTLGFHGQLSTIEDPLHLISNSELTDKTLRITATTVGDNDEILPDPSSTFVEASNIRYYLGVSGTTESFALCKTGAFTVCDTPVDMDTTPMIKSLTVGEALLSYADDLQDLSAKIVITVASTDATPSEKLEAIVTETTSKNLFFATAPGLIAAEFDVITHIIGEEVTLDIIGLTATDSMHEYVNHIITDYEVYGTAISSTSLEARWTFQTSENQYFITRDGGGSSFTEALANCNPPVEFGEKVCFGYFPGLTTDPWYRVTVAVGDGSVKTNNVQSYSISVGNPSSRETFGSLEIDHNFNWNRHGLEAEARVCFHHVASEAMASDFSHYEFVLINNQNGKWVKHKLMTNATQGELCFSPKIIPRDLFHQTEGATLVVTQRAPDGFNVLASGETQISI